MNSKTKPVHLSGTGNQACIRRGVKGNQVEFLGDPVTVIGSFGSFSHWVINYCVRARRNAKHLRRCAISIELKSGNLPV